MAQALCLSGGATRGSFQIGAIKCLYEAYGFRPDVITGTSVGAINGIKLACAPPPPVNDPAAILAAVAAGTPDAQLRHMRELEQFWLQADGRGWFFKVRPPFAGTFIADALAEDTPPGVPLGTQIDILTVALNVPVLQIFAAIAAGFELQKIKALLATLQVEDGIADMSPVETLLRQDNLDPTLPPAQRQERRNINVGMVGDAPPYTNNLYYGTPLYMATVALETGELRYITNRGEFYERDGETPVATALLDVDVDAALDENLQPLAQARRDRIKLCITNFKAAVNQIAAYHPELSNPATTRNRQFVLAAATERERQRGIYWARAAATQIRGLRIKTVVRDSNGAPDPVKGALASASLPSLILPVEIGVERYIDGGLREIIPVDIALTQQVVQPVTQLVGILCSTPNLPAADSKKNYGVIEAGLRALTEIAIHEITAGDVAATAGGAIDARIVAPTFDVHSGMDLHPSEVEISMHYGWTRAADEMHPLTVPEERDELRRTSELVARLRLKCLEIERRVKTTNVLIARTQRWDYFELRVNRWAIWHVLDRRNRRGLPGHLRQVTWATEWEREFRGSPPFQFASAWSRLDVSSDVNTDELWPAASPATWQPDVGSIEDAGNDRIYWLVRGAIFEDGTRTVRAALANVVVPNGLHQFLPRIPTGAHLMAETQDPGAMVMVVGGKKYAAPQPSWLAAVGLTGAPVALVPQGGLAQIPDGGSPYWLGGLYFSDNLRNVIHQWEPTPQIEGTTTSTKLGLTNRSARTVTVSGLTIASNQDGGGSTVFSVTTPLPLTIPADTFVWVDVQFHPLRVETITGTVSVVCDDPDVGQFTVPLATSVTPLGPHGQLEIVPSSLGLGVVQVGQQAGQNVSLTNVGARDLRIEQLEVVDSTPPGQFAIPLSYSSSLAPGQSATVYVSCLATERGPLAATLVTRASSLTDAPYSFNQRVDVTLSATARAPVIFLADAPLPARPPIIRPPRLPVPPGLPVLDPPIDIPRLTGELTHLDFGATAPGTSVSRTFWIRSTGDTPLTVAGTTTTSQSTFGFPDLSIFPAVIPPGGELAVGAAFLAPPVLGAPAGAELWIDSDDPLRPRVVLTVSGRAAGPHLTMQPAEWLNLDAGVPPAGEFIVTSDGSDPVTLTSVVVDDRDFHLTGVPVLPAELAPGTEFTLVVTYTGTTPGQHDGIVDLVHDAPTSQTRLFLRAFT